MNQATKVKIKVIWTEVIKTLLDILVFVASVSLAGLGLTILIRQGKIAEALAIYGCAFVIYCKLDLVQQRVDRILQEKILQYVRKDF